MAREGSLSPDIDDGDDSELGDVASESLSSRSPRMHIELPPRTASVPTCVTYANDHDSGGGGSGYVCSDETRAMVSALSPRILTPRPCKPPAILAEMEAAFAPEHQMPTAASMTSPRIAPVETGFLGAAEPFRLPTPPAEPMVRSHSAPLAPVRVPPLRMLVAKPDLPSVVLSRGSALAEVTLIAPHREERSGSPLVPRLVHGDDDDNGTDRDAIKTRLSAGVRTSARFRELERRKLDDTRHVDSRSGAVATLTRKHGGTIS